MEKADSGLEFLPGRQLPKQIFLPSSLCDPGSLGGVVNIWIVQQVEAETLRLGTAHQHQLSPEGIGWGQGGGVESGWEVGAGRDAWQRAGGEGPLREA